MVPVFGSDGADHTPFGIHPSIGVRGMVPATAPAAAPLRPADVPAPLVVVALAVGACAAVVADIAASPLMGGVGPGWRLVGAVSRR